MKKLTVKKNVECMACLECVRACSEAFYKEFHPDYACLQIVAKGTGAILAFCEKEEQTVEHPQCIRCGKCVAACPVHLEPLFMYQYAEKKMVDELMAANVMDCMECGACAYTCPACMHLTHMFKTGKQLVKDKAAADKAAAEAKAAKEAKEKEEKEAVNK